MMSGNSLTFGTHIHVTIHLLQLKPSNNNHKHTQLSLYIPGYDTHLHIMCECVQVVTAQINSYSSCNGVCGPSQ
jgi:hypothetical protein